MGAQGILDQFSYEGLAFSGIGLDIGGAASDRLTSELTGGLRVDYGYFAPNIRLMFGASYLQGDFDRDEITRFEQRLEAVVTDPENNASVVVGAITWIDVALDMDLQYVPGGSSPVRPYGGVGLGVHIRNGSGAAIEDTFIEDALDTIAAGLNLSAGLEVLALRSFALYLDLRASLTSELNSVAGKFGVMYRPARSER